MLLVGANVTMLCSALLKHGIFHIQNVEKHLIEWMEQNEYNSVEEMIGAMSQQKTSDPSAFERAQYMKALTYYKL
jgi:dihydroorotate dehydrogenase (fumarate)